ncbi:mechanosensitive ion channel family protein [Phenylobacterium soli]|uniref:Mechanosensitive ion channel family protein n=1 Tax=Phenylobacterium soli TaxID=2170551 RepID=A0A328APF1_9CAUL|nr:mechanosensitive ion channel domain-containing protein [Phenylobacterium soli]RAK54728.1 mechanosensitive ion channel family protein [Phenylobacterium soli]
MTLQDLINGLQAHLAWAPPWTLSVAVAAVALGLVQLVYGGIVRAVRRTVGEKNIFWRSLLVRTRGPGRLALIIFALSWSVHAAPFPPSQGATIQHGLLIAFIVLVGWVVLTALDIGAAIYMRRYRVDETDNLLARKHLTQIRILRRALATLVVVLTAAMALMTIPAVRQVGVSLLAAGGAAGIIVGLALQPVLSNLIAGVQIALTQPIRIDDGVFIQNEYGRVEEINATYVVIRLWDDRRMIVPLKYFLDQPFQNWTRESADRQGGVTFLLDYRLPIGPVRERFEEVVKASPLWDGNVARLQVTDARENVVEVRGLVSAATPDQLFDLRCEVREKVLDWIRLEFPEAVHRVGVEFSPEQAEAIRSRSGPGPGDQRVQ